MRACSSIGHEPFELDKGKAGNDFNVHDVQHHSLSHTLTLLEIGFVRVVFKSLDECLVSAS